MRRTLVAGNWKMHGSLGHARSLVQGIRDGIGRAGGTEVVVCPPFVYLPLVADLVRGSGIALGAQNVSAEEPGPFTGEVAVSMLREFDCSYAIVGHSERRSLYGETDVDAASKCARALGAGLTPIVCVGERLDEREGGRTREVVGRQLDAVIARAGVGTLAGAVLAYEPVWAIGTGRTASPEQAQEIHVFLRDRVARHDPEVAKRLRILYGGSVKSTNARSLFAMPDIDGGLIGGASLDADDFLAICEAAG